MKFHFSLLVPDLQVNGRFFSFPKSKVTLFLTKQKVLNLLKQKYIKTSNERGSSMIEIIQYFL